MLKIEGGLRALSPIHPSGWIFTLSVVVGELVKYPLVEVAPFTSHEFDKQLGEKWTVPASDD